MRSLCGALLLVWATATRADGLASCEAALADLSDAAERASLALREVDREEERSNAFRALGPQDHTAALADSIAMEGATQRAGAALRETSTAIQNVKQACSAP